MAIDPLIPQDWHDDPWDEVAQVTETSVEDIPGDLEIFKGPMKLVLTVIVASVLLLGIFGWWVVHALNPSGEPGIAVNFTVNEGDSMLAIAKRLKQENIIGNATLFRWYVSTKDGLSLVPGYYTLKPKDNAGNIIEALSTPPAQTFISVTFPEGMTVAQMAERLAQKMTFMKADDFLTAVNDPTFESTLRPKNVTSLEGLLFPDTYQISGDDTESRVISRLTSMMERVSRQIDLVSGAKLRGYSPYEILIVASLIEREAKVPADRAKIAQVIYNRLAKNMTLDIDASVLYGQDPVLTWIQMKENNTPYNLYLNKGLPPTPIANPGRASILAALSPAGSPSATDAACVGLLKGTKCEYLFYVLADSTGRHAFATTYDQHLINIDKAKAAGVLP